MSYPDLRLRLNIELAIASILQTAIRHIGTYVIRRCEREDLASVIEINMNTLPEHYSDYFFESILKELPEAFLVAELDGKVVGYIMCKIEFGFSNFHKLGFVKKGHVVSVAVLEEHRGKGLGNALMQEATAGMSARKSDEVYLEVRVSNESAVKLYEKLGFVIKTKIRGYYRDGEDAYLMALELRN
jgi:ribosomal-protein-alanine N-acetyltransferase